MNNEKVTILFTLAILLVEGIVLACIVLSA